MVKHRICEHGRRLTLCKECGGGSICEHGRRRPLCKECNGRQICEHGRVRSKCKECRGSRAAQKRRRAEAPPTAPKRAAKRRRRPFVWPNGAPPGVPVTAAAGTAAIGPSEDQVGSASGPGAGPAAEAPRKLTRYEAMWTDCDPALWEYVVV